MLEGRYHESIELMDSKLEDFWRSAEASGLLDDTMVILTSDHGEAFGDHGLYLHDASVYDTHLHVPLWIHHPNLCPTKIDDVVTTRALFRLMRAAGLGESLQDTILGRTHREKHPVAIAEHFHYPRARNMKRCYRQNLAAAVCGQHKLVCRREGLHLYNLERDPEELNPQSTTLDFFVDTLRREGASPKAAIAFVEHIRSWAARHGDVETLRTMRGSVSPIPALASTGGGISAHCAAM
jgi:arylsulfatase A-like enzyme